MFSDEIESHMQKFRKQKDHKTENQPKIPHKTVVLSACELSVQHTGKGY